MNWSTLIWSQIFHQLCLLVKYSCFRQTLQKELAAEEATPVGSMTAITALQDSSSQDGDIDEENDDEPPAKRSKGGRGGGRGGRGGRGGKRGGKRK